MRTVATVSLLALASDNVFSVWVMSAQGERVRRVTRRGAYPAWRSVPR